MVPDGKISSKQLMQQSRKSLLTPFCATPCNMLREAGVARGVMSVGGVRAAPRHAEQTPVSPLRATGHLMPQFILTVFQHVCTTHLQIVVFEGYWMVGDIWPCAPILLDVHCYANIVNRLQSIKGFTITASFSFFINVIQAMYWCVCLNSPTLLKLDPGLFTSVVCLWPCLYWCHVHRRCVSLPIRKRILTGCFFFFCPRGPISEITGASPSCNFTPLIVFNEHYICMIRAYACISLPQTGVQRFIVCTSLLCTDPHYFSSYLFCDVWSICDYWGPTRTLT